MCGGTLGRVAGFVTDAIGLTDTKKAEKVYDAQAAEDKAKREAQLEENNSKAQRKKRKASVVLSSTDENQKQTTLGG